MQRIVNYFVVSAVIVLIGLAAPANAGFDEGVAAYERGDFALALRELRPLAKHGHAAAQYNLGFMYDSGRGVPQDYAKAAKWYRKAAEQGHASGQFNLAILYENGRGAPKDSVQAAKWFRKAADQGDAHAQFNLGIMYAEGQGLPQNYIQAHKWINLAAAQGIKKATKNRDLIVGHMTPTQLASAQRLARAWRPKKQSALGVSRPATKSSAGNRQRISRVQRNLASLGYDLGPADGIMDRKTRAVIRAFQAKLGLPITGELSDGLEIAIRAEMRAIASIGRAPQDPVKIRLTGSGIIVSSAGHILTNAHVVDRCGTNPTAIYSLVVPIDFSGSIDSLNDRKRRSGAAFRGRPLTLIAIDTGNDLAVLSSSAPAASIAIFRDKPSPRMGESVVVAGFALPGGPTSNLLVSTGTIGPVIGLGKNRHMIQITAPIQPANIGGPVFDLSGNVVGVVVSRLDALKLARRTSQLSQNGNFAIGSAIARAFLDAHKIAYKNARSTVVLSPVNIAARARAITVLVGCAK